MKREPMPSLFTPAGEAFQKDRERIPWEDDYPRPGMRRDSFFCLNGWWDFSEDGAAWEKIRVPFPPESPLSGIGRRLGRDPHPVYRRAFRLPEHFTGERILLHFGAVDQIAGVTLNGHFLGEHRGGYGHFSFDVTDVLAEENILTVEVSDELHNQVLPYGKQREKRGGMWYTPVTGIWQTVWMEGVPEQYVESLTIHTGTMGCDIRLTGQGCEAGTIRLTTPVGERVYPIENGMAQVVLDPAEVRLWSPEDPYLYHFTAETASDCVTSYFALRTLEVRTVNGVPRLCLNGKPYFFHAVLDQGYWPDGIFTPAAPEAYAEDILAMKELGFNTLRKHIKVEPDRFYYDCDRLGMVVFQDMVNNGDYSFLRDTALPTVGLKRLSDRWMHRDPAARRAFRDGMAETVLQLGQYPSVCLWTIFNEGWGQFDGAAMWEELRKLDDTRWIDTASGWFSGVPSDVVSEHVYFKPVKIQPAPKPVILSEFGGYAHGVAEHRWNPGASYGYRNIPERKAYQTALEALYRDEILPAVKTGLCAAVFTQLSDVEDEINGLLTYDRRVCKADPEAMREIARLLMEAVSEQ